MEAKALAALVPAMAAAQKELSADLAAWLTKLGPNAHLQKFTPAHLKQLQLLLGIAEAKAQTSAAGYPHASFPMVAAKAVQNVMGQQQPQKLAAATLENELSMLRAKFADLPGPQLVQAALLAKGDHLVMNQFKNSAQRYAGQVKDDLKFQFGVGLSKGENVQQLANRIAKLSGFQKAVDASHPPSAGAAMGGALTKRYNHWAQRLVRTELSGAYNKVAAQGIVAAHKLDDRILMMWDATNDLRVCIYCKSLHGTKVTPGSGAFKGGHLQPPAHPNCRCALVAWVDDDEDLDSPLDLSNFPTADEIEAKEAQAYQVEAAAQRREAAAKDAKAAAAEDLAAYDTHQQKLAADKLAAQKAAAAAKAAKEEAEYQAMLAAQKKAAEAAAKKAAADAKKAADAAKKALVAAPFDPKTSPYLHNMYEQKGKGGSAIISKGGFAYKDKDTIVGHGYTYKWNPKLGWWQKTEGPTGYEWKHQGYQLPSGQMTQQYQSGVKSVFGWESTKPVAPPPAPPPPVKPVAGPKPGDIKGYQWKDVNGQWVLHNTAGVPTSQLVPAYKSSVPAMNDTYSLGADIASKGLVPTGPGVMEGYGYKFVKNPQGLWEKTQAKGQPYVIPPKKATPSYSSPSSSYTPPTPAPAWKPTPIKLAPNRKGVTDFNAHPSHEYAGFHGRAFTQDGDMVEGGSVRVLKVKDTNGNEYYETAFKVTHPFGAATQTYGTGSRSSWTFRQRELRNGVMHDMTHETTQSVGTRIYQGKDHTVEIGTDGAVKNLVRIRANSLAELNAAMDNLSNHLGGDLRKPPTKEDLELQAKARLAAKFDPAEFGRRMQSVASPEQQKQVIEDVFKAQAAKHPIVAKALADAKEVEVYPGHKTLYSKALGQHLKETYGAMYHDSSAPADVAAKVAGETGLMSSLKRFSSGVFTTGMSTGTDFGTGGADGVFMRLSKGVPSSTGGQFRVIIDTEKVMGRLDWWAFNSDTYGRADYDRYGSRWSIPTMKTGHAAGDNEVMATHGVPTSAMKKIICSSESYRQQVLTTLRKQGITQIDGRKIEDFIVAR